MKKLKLTAIILAMSLSAVSAFSCSGKTTSSPEQSITLIDPDQPEQQPITKYSADAKKTNSSFGQEMEVNSTAFTLNSVVRIKDASSGNDYIYINVTIKNKTDIEYKISSLNNFFLALPDNQEVSSDVRTRLYALNNFSKCVDDYITIPANGEFTGFLAGGFIVPSGTDSMTVGFFPTLDNEINKSEVILAPVSADDISTDDSVLK
ncbi:MAG: DUF4352 domain-containing protein [Ruminococcus sp.]|nr:DUF4352 domain-containing protein [Ruminococcus sp.]